MKMFGKKSNVTIQRRMKEVLLADVNALLYKFEKGRFNIGLYSDTVQSIVKDVRIAYESIKNSVGTGDEDISLGCTKVREDLIALQKASQENLVGRFEDCALSLIEDMNEILDLENGLISEISSETDDASKKQKFFQKKLLEIESFGQEFNSNRNRVEKEIAKIERDKKELDTKLLEESNPRIKQNIFRQIKASLNKVAALQLKSDEYSSCFNLLDSIKIYGKELVELGDLSSVEMDKAKIVLNINRIKYVLDDPSKLQSLLKVIELDLKKSQEKIKTREQQIDNPLNLGGASYDEMNEYQNTIIKQRHDKEEISGNILDLKENLKKLSEK